MGPSGSGNKALEYHSAPPAEAQRPPPGHRSASGRCRGWASLWGVFQRPTTAALRRQSPPPPSPPPQRVLGGGGCLDLVVGGCTCGGHSPEGGVWGLFVLRGLHLGAWPCSGGCSGWRAVHISGFVGVSGGMACGAPSASGIVLGVVGVCLQRDTMSGTAVAAVAAMGWSAPCTERGGGL